MRVGALAGGEDGRVLEEQHGVVPRARDDLGVHLALEVPGGEVVDGVVTETGDLDVERERGDLVPTAYARRSGPVGYPGICASALWMSADARGRKSVRVEEWTRDACSPR